ncbi:putative phosphatidylglycerol/phosphatidylinositol transfer protein DDB_G0282179 [Chenopodium quinoa]|uniref:putative phosphatidylglycerol/phosphatidylinositol transfer protein DDB_G0282179 n=1 Tax=Chenopodium quinoa TaxID=63459 RepID=UPI000B772404|nr:putative phosphatidylglycerol/phosphatidylinositol transfer protein DDB_G0282179 [Chenopodium quinoa]
MAICKLQVFIFLCLCLSAPSILAKSVKKCDKKANYAVEVKGVEFHPDPVVPGKEAVFSISASSEEVISGGKVVIDVSYFGLHVHSETIDLCQETSCPIPAGDFVLSHKQTLPIFTPPGSYILKLRIMDSSNQLLSCGSFGFKIGFGESAYDS